MRFAAVALCLVAAACAPTEVLMGRGLDDFGRRYIWAKDGAADIDRRRAMIACADQNQAKLEDAMRTASIPFVGLASIGPSMAAEHETLTERVACMEGSGWRLIDVTTGQAQAVSFSWGMATLTPR
jgi:hypothetical protein